MAKKDDSVNGIGHNVGQAARSAVLHIASTNTALFMTTLSLDIAQPASPDHKKSVMQLVVFMIRKVRSLDMQSYDGLC